MENTSRGGEPQRYPLLEIPKDRRRDNTISFQGKTFQLPKTMRFVRLARKNAEARVLRNKLLEVWYKNEKVAGFANQKLKREVA
jgi:hypothetical protein